WRLPWRPCWSRRSHEQESTKRRFDMSGNPVTWFEIYVKDMERAKAFYEKTLGLKLQKLETPAEDVAEMWSFPTGQPDRYGATGALVKIADGPSGVGGTMVYFE